ncbi:MAG: hypothetical protein HC872_01950 [Gammaproteobacteria bacterium]|nr:hypothetical protein [Gammaproteobacteria bacterium]
MHPLGTLSYCVAAAAYLALSVMLLTRWRQRFHGSLLLPAALVSFAWSAALAWQLTRTAPPLTGSFFFLEIVRNVLWLAVLLRALSNVAARDIPRWVYVMVYGTAGTVMIAGLALGVLHDLGHGLQMAPRVLIPGMLLLALIGFVLVEQVSRNTRSGQEWAVKFLWIGAGAVIAYDLCLYSIALLFNQIPLVMWEARGAANALAVPLLAVAVNRTAQWSPQVFLSRRPVLYTTSIIAAGVYLLVGGRCRLLRRRVRRHLGSARRSSILMSARRSR